MPVEPTGYSPPELAKISLTSRSGWKPVSMLVFDDSVDVAVGDGAGDMFYRVPAAFDGLRLKDIEAVVQTAGVTGTTLVQLHNVTKGVDMLTTGVSIDDGETDSKDAATTPVIDTNNNIVNTGDILRPDVDTVQTGTAPLGLMLEMHFG